LAGKRPTVKILPNGAALPYTPDMPDTTAPHARNRPWRRLLDELTAAALFLTRLPLPCPAVMPPDLHGRSAGWYPLIGALIGLAGSAVFVLAQALGLAGAPAALLALAAQTGLTGALHEDGLADTADGFGGGRDKAAKLAIMRDSRLGSYGAMALIFSIGLRASALASLPDPVAVTAALAAAGALSRAALVALYGGLAPARTDGLGATLGRPDRGRVALALGLGFALAVAGLGLSAIPAVLAAAVAALAVARLARRQIGGYTGDVLGAAQQAAEIAVLLALAAVLR
jgi:adenosylcobinamide-GDP ribazoletransferase